MQCPKSLVLSNLDEDSTTSDLSPLEMKNHALVILCTEFHFIFLFLKSIVITITNPGGLVIIVTLTKHENKRINNNNNNFLSLFDLFPAFKGD